MRTRRSLLTAVFGAGTLILTSGGGQNVDASDVCFSTHTTGAGATLMTFCISRHGNVVQFESPDGAEHIRVGLAVHGEG